MANTVDKVINIALNEVGYLEKKSNSQLDSKTANVGDKNYTKYGRDMHKLYPSVMDFPAYWCDAFVDWCFYKAYGTSNAKSLLGGDFNDYTVASAQLYQNKGRWYKSNPKVGDQIFFKNTQRICHTGIVYKVDNSYVYTVEGNTSSGSGVVANGGCVAKKKYKLSNSSIAGYGRPKYDVEKATTSTKSTSTSTSSKSKTVKVDNAKSFDKKLADTYVTTSNLNLRCGAGTNKDIITTIKSGAKVRCYGYYTSINGVKWYLVVYDKYSGFVSSKYLK